MIDTTKNYDDLVRAYKDIQTYKYPGSAEIFQKKVNGEEAARDGLIKIDLERGIFTSNDIAVEVATANRHIEVLDEYYVSLLSINSYQNTIEDTNRELEVEEERLNELSNDAQSAKTDDAVYRSRKLLNACKQRIRSLKDTIATAQRTYEQLTEQLKEEKDVVVKSRDEKVRVYQAGATEVLGSELPECNLEELLKYYNATTI